MATRAARRQRPHRATKARIRNRPGRERVLAGESSVSATEAKNKFGRILEQVIRGGRVMITRHADPKAVLLSMEEYSALSGAPAAKLNMLTEEFDALYARMQTPEWRRGLKAAFDASPEELGRAALAAARQRE